MNDGRPCRPGINVGDTIHINLIHQIGAIVGWGCPLQRHFGRVQINQRRHRRCGWRRIQGCSRRDRIAVLGLVARPINGIDVERVGISGDQPKVQIKGGLRLRHRPCLAVAHMNPVGKDPGVIGGRVPGQGHAVGRCPRHAQIARPLWRLTVFSGRDCRRG